jgi:hypothetical protein
MFMALSLQTGWWYGDDMALTLHSLVPWNRVPTSAPWGLAPTFKDQVQQGRLGRH